MTAAAVGLGVVAAGPIPSRPAAIADVKLEHGLMWPC